MKITVMAVGLFLLAYSTPQLRAEKKGVDAAPGMMPCPPPEVRPPAYPERLRRRGIGGTVMVEAVADACGKIVELTLVESSGHAELDQAALEAARHWIFAPDAVARFPGRRWTMPVGFNSR